MLEHPSTSLPGPDGPIKVVFSEASPSQKDQISKLTWAAFGVPLPEADHIEREEYLLQSPINANGGMRYWCLAIASDDNLGKVVATCKTVHRDLLVRDKDGCREEQGYCIASVVTDPHFRKHGLQTLLLKNVADWMDRDGGATASTLYTSVGDVC
jgi:GNAT superfamily N-acetyltransferase